MRSVDWGFLPTITGRSDRHRPGAGASVISAMTRFVVTVSPSLSSATALQVARENGVRRLPVVDLGQLVGVVATDELARAGEEPVARCVGRPPVTIPPTATLDDARACMRVYGVGCLPVVASGLLYGILTRGDLRRAGLPGE